MYDGSLDTNVLLRLVLKDNPEQHRQIVSLLSRSRKQFAVADTALIELAFVLSRHYKFDRTDVGKTFMTLLSLPILNCNRMLFNRALPLYLQHQALSFEDCCLVIYAELNNAEPLWTFDKKLANQTPQAKLV